MGVKQNIDVNVDLTEILNQIDEKHIIDHYTKEMLLEHMGYHEDLCFETTKDLKEAVEEDAAAYDLELKEYFDGMNDNDIYDRFLNLLCNNKLTYLEWDEILSKYE